MKYNIKYNRVFDKAHKIVEISSITKENRDSEYFSIGTLTPMVAALGDKNQHYFRAKKGYSLNPETELHEYVKKMLKYRFDTEEQFFIRYHSKECCPNGKNCIFYDEKYGGCEKLKEVFTEHNLKDYYDTATIEASYGGFVADVLLTSSSHPSRMPVFLEVAVTHRCSIEKINSKNKIIELLVKGEEDAYCDLEETDPYGLYGERVIRFHNFKKEIKEQNCPHFVTEKKYAQQPITIIQMYLPTKFYCIPQQLSGNPLQVYYDNVQIGMLFASNSWAKPFVFDKAISQDRRSFVMMGKDIYGAVKPWVIYVVTWNGKRYNHKVFSHFDYQSALKDFTIYQGKEWYGGETLSDLC
ncbi:MAG: hypothetical protein IKT00_13005 [Prevotella sp.]|nr:hypothetical protein [Prevotella sp.]